MDDHLRANRDLWDAWTPITLASRMYDVEAFAAGGGDDLDPVARAGPGDVRGRSLLHLQCHFGMDTIRWARHGAVVTGVDFSPRAIAEARALAARMGVPATFVESDVLGLPAALDGRFDVVFTSHGVLAWLPDLDGWAQVIAHFLAPGGLFYVVDVHPVLTRFDDRAREPALRLLYPYFHGPSPIREEHRGCYAEPDAPIASVEHVWLHTLSDVVGALLRAGLRIESFEEYPFLAWPFFPWMERGADGWWRLPGPPALALGAGALPLMFSLRARRDA